MIGLDHPDKDNPPQTVNAVMNSIVSTTETLQADDISGARALYDGRLAPSTPCAPYPPFSLYPSPVRAPDACGRDVSLRACLNR